MSLYIPFRKFLKESEIINKEVDTNTSSVFTEIVKFLKDKNYITKDDSIGEWVLAEEATLLELINRNMPPEMFEQTCPSCDLEKNTAISETVTSSFDKESIDDAINFEVEKELNKVNEEIDAEQEAIEEEEKEIENEEEKIEEEEEEIEDEEKEIEEEEEEIEEEEEEIKDEKNNLKENKYKFMPTRNNNRYERLKKFVKEANQARRISQRMHDSHNRLEEAKKRRMAKIRLLEAMKKKRFSK